MNSNTTDRTHVGGGRRRQTRRRSSTAPHKHTHGHAQPLRAPAPVAPTLEPLEPFDCDTAPAPFTSLKLDPRLLEGIRDLGFVETRPIQSAVIPLALAGADLIACAETGTGKTVAFVVPMLQKLLTAVSATGKSRVLVLAPTRELAVQIEDEIHGLAYHTTITSAAVYGGVEMGPQERALRAAVDIIVATPGRLIDHLRQQNTDLSGIELLVLDEADRMMDMGFWPDVRRIIATLPHSSTGRQTLLFSATMPNEVVRDALEITKSARYLQVGRRSAPPRSITHRAQPLSRGEKLAWLIEYLRHPQGPVLVFTRTKIGADRLARQLSVASIRCTALHADRSQDQRRVAVEGFKSGRYKVLVATDIAARGLDIDAIHTVVNYEVPDSPETYVHRVGRTGRADEVGEAITLVAPEERRALESVVKAVGLRLE